MKGAQVRVYSRTKDGNTAVMPHFKVREFACQDGSDTVFVSQDLAQVLEKIRLYFERPVVITSGYRTEGHNAACGGAAYSQHKYGMAADIAVSGIAPAEVAACADRLLGNRGGVGTYSSFCHVDVRAEKSRWKG